jgi:hypothetical protein
LPFSPILPPARTLDLRSLQQPVPIRILLLVDDILDAGRKSTAVECNDLPPLAVVNKVGSPRAALPTLVSFTTSYAYEQGGSGLVWDERLHQLVEPNADERERAMGF